jgi:PAS domain S-box-containing protein
MAKRRRTSEAVQESEAQLDPIFQSYQSIGESIVAVNDQQRIVLFNSAAEQMFGHTAASIIGRPLSVLLPKRFRRTHRKSVHNFGATEQRGQTMNIYRPVYGLRANGEEFLVECSISQVGISSKKLYTAILRDVTERKKAEQAREQLIKQLELLSKRLTLDQEENHRKIAHKLHEELGQELTVLRLFLQMMEPNGADAGAKNPRDEALAVAAQTMERLRNLVMDLAPPELDDLGLHSAVRSLCRRQAGTGGWSLHIDAPKPDARAPLLVERACFHVLQEGLRNVLKHAKATEVWVHLHHSANEIELKVRDNGVGFDCDLACAFDTREGTHLGLFGMQNRAKQAGGVVEFKSKVGIGTEIRAVFYLPVDAL